MRGITQKLHRNKQISRVSDPREAAIETNGFTPIILCFPALRLRSKYNYYIYFNEGKLSFFHIVSVVVANLIYLFIFITNVITNRALRDVLSLLGFFLRFCYRDLQWVFYLFNHLSVTTDERNLSLFRFFFLLLSLNVTHLKSLSI